MENSVSKYEKIINLPHHVSKKHPQMPISDRAAQFAPYSALTGYGEEIKKTADEANSKDDVLEKIEFYDDNVIYEEDE